MTGATGVTGTTGATGVVTTTFFDNIVGNMSGGVAIDVSGAGMNRPRIAPFLSGDVPLPFSITASTFMVDMFQSGSTATMSQAFTSTVFMGIYTATSDSLSLVNSVSFTFGFAAAATNNSTGFAGSRYITVNSSQWSAAPAFAQGSNYYLAVFFNSAGVNNQSISLLGAFKYYTTSALRSGSVGVANDDATTRGAIPFLGGYASTTNAIPATIANSEIRKTNVTDYVIPHILMNARPALSSF